MSKELPHSVLARPRVVAVALLLAIAALSALAAAFFPRSTIDETRAATGPRQPTVARLDLGTACRGNQWIGILKEEVPQACPAGWSHLFAPSALHGEAEDQRASGSPDCESPCDSEAEAIPPGLRRFCVSHDIPMGEDPRIAMRSIDAGWASYDVFDRIDQDCSVVGVAAAETYFPVGDFDEALKARFWQEAGKPASLPATSEAPAAVRLVIVDSAPDSAAPQDAVVSGRSRARRARMLAPWLGPGQAGAGAAV